MLPSLNGFRAVSICLVLVSHAAVIAGWPRIFYQGDLGVRIFFVISGFLITYLLVTEEATTGKINIAAFYGRRAVRILPVYYTYLLALYLFASRHISACQWATSLTFTKDFGCPHDLDGHFWSLSVEEQFYLAWPCLLAFGGRRVAAFFAAIVMAASPVARIFDYLTINPMAPHALQTNADMLMYGCALALIMDRWPHCKKYSERHPSLVRAGGIAMIVLPIILERNLMLAPLTVPFGMSLQAIGVAILIFSLVYCERGVLFWFLNLRAVSAIGVLSYSIYVWQQPFFSDYVDATLFARVMLALAAASASYVVIERPLLRLRKRLRRSAAPSATAEPTSI